MLRFRHGSRTRALTVEIEKVEKHPGDRPTLYDPKFAREIFAHFDVDPYRGDEKGTGPCPLFVSLRFGEAE